MIYRKASFLALLSLTSFALAGQYAAPAPSASDKAEYTKAQSGYESNKKAFTKSPKNAKLKGNYVASTVKFGTTCMMTTVLDRKVKYRKALQLYREALKVDPNNHEAKNNKEMIEAIYRSMHRPIPQ